MIVKGTTPKDSKTLEREEQNVKRLHGVPRVLYSFYSSNKLGVKLLGLSFGIGLDPISVVALLYIKKLRHSKHAGNLMGKILKHSLLNVNYKSQSF